MVCTVNLGLINMLRVSLSSCLFRVRIRPRFLLRRLLCSILSVAVFVSGCATMKLPEYKAQSIEAYPNSHVKDGLMVAVDPVTEESELKKYFGINLFAKGLLPVLVVAENRSKSSSFVLSKDQVFIQKAESNREHSSERKDVTSTGGGIAMATVGAALLALPLVVVGLKMSSNATVIENNLAEKQLYRTTVSPGHRVHGFTYFQIPKEKEFAPGHCVSVEALQLPAGNKVTFEFPLNLMADK